MKAKRQHINVFDFNVCGEKCDCGWNVSMGSYNKKALNDILKILKKYGIVRMKKLGGK